MPSQAVIAKYRPTIGIECHVQLKTQTKLFSGADNDARQAEPNTLVNHIDFGLPGALPVLNKQAIKLASIAAIALNTVPQPFSKFDRKHYFYPDLPMGYQISQYDEPIILGGFVEIYIDDKIKKIGITRAHLEADAGKSNHPSGKDYSLVDLNRAGTPLLEIVSQPELHSALEAKAYAQELYLIMRYAGVSDCDLFYGNMRFDVNVSVSQNDVLGTRTETKNLNSFKSVEKTIEYEINRQIEVIESGQHVIQETRGWDDAKAKTFSQRTKENADDYRYMPDPDIPPVVLDQQYIDVIKFDFPVTPKQWRTRLSSVGLSSQKLQVLLEAELDDDAIDYLTLISQNIENIELAKFIANWLVNLEIPLRKDKIAKLDSLAARLKLYTETEQLLNSGQLSSTNLKSLLTDLLSVEKLPQSIATYAKDKGLLQLSDSSTIDKIVTEVIKANAQAAEDVKNGELKAIGFLVGQVMKASQGQANPSLAQDLIKKQLGIS